MPPKDKIEPLLQQAQAISLSLQFMGYGLEWQKANNLFIRAAFSFSSQVHAQYAKIKPWTCFGLRIIDLNNLSLTK
jgi:hypothetical protein